MIFTLKNKKTKKEVAFAGISMEEFVNGDTPVISVFVGEGESREVINFPRDTSTSINDFVSVENEEYTLTAKSE